jgi:WD40 repeat protein
MLTSAQTQLHVISTPGADAPNAVILNKPMSTNSTVRSVAISQDGNFLAIGRDRKVYLYNLRDTECHMDTLDVHEKLEQGIESQRLNFSLDGSKLVLATRDGSGNIGVRLYAHESKVGSVWEMS